MGSKIFAPKGTRDLLPDEVKAWEMVEGKIKEICKTFNYKQIRVPDFEHYALFDRGVGESTDIVSKEMYTLNHRGKDVFALKPEGTSSVIRAYIEHGMSSGITPAKLYYITSCFRSERPQKGRQRQFHQFGIEAIGSYSASMDAEVIMLVNTLFKKLGIKGLQLRINSVGCPKCRSAYYEKLKEYVKPFENELCEDCRDRLNKNPMRILDCKNEHCKTLLKDAPLMVDYLCEECNEHFESVKDYLTNAEIEFVVDPKIVRGLDYYTQTAFEFVSTDLGSQGTVCGGGRYNGLVKMIGGPDTPGVGFGLGLERLMLIMEEQGLLNDLEDDEIDVYLAPVGKEASKVAFKTFKKLTDSGIKASIDVMDRSLKAQMKYANKVNTKYTAILGEDELQKGVYTLRDMRSKEQEEVNIENLFEYIKEKLGE